MTTKKTPPNDITCPLCQHDEYFISENGEKFTCGSCGFHTKQFSQINPTNLVPINPQPQSVMHCLSSACH
ncbi:MAG: hypothetical protein ACPG5L_02460 [Vibrio gallaecicus]|uniref:Transcription initiation factor TFIIIB n=1 Tax=Vibrio gallaecicus TaxID=552386 RepID=A0ABV4NH59_9VIBR|nr:hypothetical protein [Vibrio gallaecicus]NOH99176.1 hypothetical protein [Vibrio sp. 99-70-13A1]